jgi:hypothetical protein
MVGDCLTQTEREVMRGIYERDVKYWDNWGPCVKMAKRNGQCPMGLTWVVLCYKPGPELPQLREELNGLYLQALQGYAAHYHLSVCVDLGINKVVLYDPEQADSRWLEKCIVPSLPV